MRLDQPISDSSPLPPPLRGSRRSFLKHSAAAAVAGAVAAKASPARGQVAGSDEIRIGLVGCGGRGTGAAVQALAADPHTRLVAVADAFEDRLELGMKSIARNSGERAEVDRDHRFTGFDGYRGVIESDVDVVLLATPPHFRPMHLQAAIESGKHVFAEKPVAVDAPGVRSVLATCELARQNKLSVVSGLNSRYSHRMQEIIGRIHEGAIGDIVTAHSVRYAGGVWVRPRKPDMTEMEYQMRNWYYFTWLSGDFNVEQFVHQYDQIAWAFGDEYPVRCYGTGGRQARTGPEYGHIYDHFASTFEYEDGKRAFTTTRHQRNCSNESGVILFGTKGTADLSYRNAVITGENPWRMPDSDERDSHQLEHDAFFAALRKGDVINNGDYMARSTMMAIMARMSAYTGQTLMWDQVMNSEEHLAPSAYAWDAEPPEAVVAIPGVTEFV
jgi:myo-inositol 2-dehydrogenase / D-chiro-inositol 1-dehydrogenase